MASGGHFEKMAAKKACGHDILWIVGWISLKFDVMVVWVFPMIWLTIEKKNL